MNQSYLHPLSLLLQLHKLCLQDALKEDSILGKFRILNSQQPYLDVNSVVITRFDGQPATTVSLCNIADAKPTV